MRLPILKSLFGKRVAKALEKSLHTLPLVETMKSVLVYSGLGMYEETSAVLLRSLYSLLDVSVYKIEYVTPEQIVDGKLDNGVAMLAIGGGYDLGLIKALGETGMTNIRNFIHDGGSYLGICSGAYFACDRIEFDKDGPQQVIGDRHLKFFPGCGKGPLYKPFVYRSERGAVASKISFRHSLAVPSKLNGFIEKESTKNGFIQNNSLSDTADANKGYKSARNVEVIESQTNGKIGDRDTVQCSVYFNGGCYFDVDNDTPDVTVVSRYLDLSDLPPAIVRCTCREGVAVLCGPHIEYDASDLDDDDKYVRDILPELEMSSDLKTDIMKCLLKDLRLAVK